MAIQAKEKVVTTILIEDTRGLSRAEIVGMITIDLIDAENNDEYYNFIDLKCHRSYILEKIVTDCIHKCHPETKSVEIILGKDETLFENEEYRIQFLPAGNSGIDVCYTYRNSANKITTDTINWDIEQCLDLLNIDWED